MKRMWSKNELKSIIQNQSSSGELKNVKVFEEIVDKDGHKRFIDGNITITEREGFTQTYGKYSLSGSHLLIVLALSCANTAVINDGSTIANIEIPKWVYDKLVPLYASTIIDRGEFTAYANDYSTQNFNAYCIKISDNKIRLTKAGNVTFTADRQVRITFDFLIDNE